MGIRTLLGLLWNWCLLIHLHHFRGRSPCWNLHNLNSLQSKRPRRPPSSHYPGHLQPRILWQQSPLPWFLRLYSHCSPGADVDIEQQWPWTVTLANFKTLRLYLLISPAPGVAATETWTLHSDIQTFRVLGFPKSKKESGEEQSSKFQRVIECHQEAMSAPLTEEAAPSATEPPIEGLPKQSICMEVLFQ